MSQKTSQCIGKLLFLTMKKVLLILVAVIGFGISANAQFSSTQKVCSSQEGLRYEFYSNGTYKVFTLTNGQEVQTGTYTRSSTRNIISTKNQWDIRTDFIVTITNDRLERMHQDSSSYTVYTRCN